jgi:hydrogenase nickel incorporation protein HypB
MSVVTIERKVLEKNDVIAQKNRDTFAGEKIFVVNIVSSPGAGKTSLLEQSLTLLRNKIGIAVIEGDVQTDLDAQRMSKFNIPAVQIVTKGGCHLDAPLIADAMQNLDFKKIQILIIENVGNLVCPANYDLGEALKIVVASTTEGDDKPLKYPSMFRNASVLVINKIDLLPYVPCSIETLKNNALQINPHLKVFETSCTTGKGIAEFCAWLESNILKGK